MLFSWDYPIRENSVKSSLSFQVSINFSRCLQKPPHSICRNIRTQNTKREHLCNRSPASPQEVLWPCLDDLLSTTLCDVHPVGPASHASCPLSADLGTLVPRMQYYHLSPAAKATGISLILSVRGTSPMGTWG